MNGFGKVKKDAPPDLWRGAGGGAAAMKVQETELQPLRANEFEAAVPPPAPGMYVLHVTIDDSAKDGGPLRQSFDS